MKGMSQQKIHGVEQRHTQTPSPETSNPTQPYRLAGDCLAARLLVLNVNHKCTLAAVKAKHVLVQSVSQGQ